MAKERMSFKEINQINVSDRVQEKMNLSYLSWAWAHAEMKKIDEESDIIIHEFPDMDEILTLVQAGAEYNEEMLKNHKINYKKDSGGAYVKVTVVLYGREETEYLPVMDFKNKSMIKPTSMDVNKAHKRCFVKALALHGLGLYIYAGEDLPEEPPAKKINETQISSLNTVIKSIAKMTNQTLPQARKGLLKHAGLPNNIKELDEDQYGTFLRYLNDLKQKYEKKAKQEKAKAKKGETNGKQDSLFEGNTTKPKSQ